MNNYYCSLACDLSRLRSLMIATSYLEDNSIHLEVQFPFISIFCFSIWKFFSSLEETVSPGRGKAWLTKCRAVLASEGWSHLWLPQWLPLGAFRALSIPRLLPNPQEGPEREPRPRRPSSPLRNQTLINYHSKHRRRTISFIGTDVKGGRECSAGGLGLSAASAAPTMLPDSICGRPDVWHGAPPLTSTLSTGLHPRVRSPASDHGLPNAFVWEAGWKQLQVTVMGLSKHVRAFELLDYSAVWHQLWHREMLRTNEEAEIRSWKTRTHGLRFKVLQPPPLSVGICSKAPVDAWNPEWYRSLYRLCFFPIHIYLFM